MCSYWKSWGSSIVRIQNIIKLLLLLIVISPLAACGGGGGGGDKGGGKGNNPKIINGAGVKGPLLDAEVFAFLVDYNAAADLTGAQVASGVTDKSAAIKTLSLPVPLSPPYIFEFAVEDKPNPQTIDLTTGMAPVIAPMRTVIREESALSNQVYASPITTMAVKLAILKADSNTPPYMGNTDGQIDENEFFTALDVAAQQVVSVLGFGLDPTTDIFSIPPLIDDTTTDVASQALTVQYRIALEATTAVLYQMSQDAGSNIMDVLDDMVADLSDGAIDGMIDGTPTASYSAAELTILTNANPDALVIPNTNPPRTIADIEAILIEEKATTGSTTDTSSLPNVDPQPAKTVPDSVVPNVVNMTQADAENAVLAAGLISTSIGENNATVPAGVIIRQEPVDGLLPLGSLVTLYVSLGPVMVEVPDVLGMTEAAAISEITGVGLQACEITQVSSSTVAIGNVVSQTPSAGDMVAENGCVDLEISSGIAMPNVIGMNIEVAVVTLQNAGFTDITSVPENSASPVNSVTQQSENVGVNLNADHAIVITYSIGLSMPNVTGLSVTDAQDALQNAGFTNVALDPVDSTATKDSVLSQNIEAGTNQDSGIAIVLTVSDGMPLPNVIGMTQTEAIAALNNAGFTNINPVVVGGPPPADAVLSQNPSGPSQQDVGITVTISVSDGSQEPVVPDVSGIWRLSLTPSGTSVCTPMGPGNAQYLQFVPELKQYVSIEQAPAPSSASITVHFMNGEQGTGAIDSSNNFALTTASKSWTDVDDMPAQEDFTLSGTIVDGEPPVFSGQMINTTVTGGDTCSQTFDYAAEFVFEPLGSEEYSGTYQTEMLDISDDINSEPSRESFVYDIDINQGDAQITVAFLGEEDDLVKITAPLDYNPVTGVAKANLTENILINWHDDGLFNDLEVNETALVIMFVRSDVDTSGAPTFVSTFYEGRKYYFNNVSPAPGTVPDEVAKDVERGYARLVQPEPFTLSDHHPVDGSNAEQNYVKLGIRNPALMRLDNLAGSTYEVYDPIDDSTVCSRSFLSRYRFHEEYPAPDMSLEGFSNSAYNWIHCPVDPALVQDGRVYNVYVRDSSNALQYTYNLTATLADFAAGLPSRRSVDIGGATSSKTRRGDVIRLHGFFNPLLDIPVQVPVSSDPDIEYYRLRFTDSNDPIWQVSVTSPTNNLVIPARSVFEDGWDDVDWQMRLIERYDRNGNKGQSHSRSLKIQSGIRALVNIELMDPAQESILINQLWLAGATEGASVTCLVTRLYEDAAGNLSGCGTGTITFANSQVDIPVSLFAGAINGNLRLIFADSVNAAATLSYPGVTLNGNARVVNPEIFAVSQIDRTGNVRTDVVMQNPFPQFNLATLSGANLSPVTLWDSENVNTGLHYVNKYNSYSQSPLFDGEPQSTGAYVAWNSGSGLQPADTFSVVLSNLANNSGITHTYRVTYDGDNPAVLTPPVRSQMWINGIKATSYGYNAPFDTASTPITQIMWEHPADTNDFTDELEWTIRYREVGTGGGNDHIRHGEIRPRKLSVSDPDLTYTTYNDGGIVKNVWIWTASEELSQVRAGSKYKIQVRASNPSNTIRGLSQGVFVTNSSSP